MPAHVPASVLSELLRDGFGEPAEVRGPAAGLVGCVAESGMGGLWAVHGPSVLPGEVMVESLDAGEGCERLSFPAAVVAGWVRVA